MMVARTFTVLALLTGLGACAGPPVPFDRAASPRIETIGILTPDLPVRPIVFVWGSPEQHFGLIGALTGAAVRVARENRFIEATASQPFSAVPALSERLVAELAAQGYRAHPVAVERVKTDFLEKYDGLAPAADAWLDCTSVEWGYLAAGIGDDTPYRPYLNLTCRMVRAVDGKVLMRDRIVYNWALSSNPTGIVTLPPDPAFAFATSDMLVADPVRAVQGLQAGFRATAAAVGTLLK